jgi:hypothetical protein
LINNTRGAAFFAALNTGQGFKSYFREIFDKVETVYIIKGGSGTGKSRFMREVELAANAKGYNCEDFLCSSDPTSLDGIIIKRLNVAVLDGTSPHVHEPTLIGAREKFLDFSAFLDSDKLKPLKNEIEALMKEKAERYATIYSYLKAIATFDSLIMDLALKSLDEEKMDKSVCKSLSLLKQGNKFEKNVRIRAAISCKGHIVLNTYAKIAAHRYAVNDLCGLGGIYLKKLMERAEERKIPLTVSYDPFNPEFPDALYFPDSDTSFYVGAEGDYEENTVNMKRFAKDSILRLYKAEIRAIRRVKSAANEQLDYNFAQINKLHTAIEKIYSSAMRFEGKEQLTKDFIKQVLK